jgi:membrane associated rhomboid family serine protease
LEARHFSGVSVHFNVLRPFLLWIIAGNFIISGVSVIGHASGAVAGAVLGFIDYSYDSIKQSIRKDSWRKYGIPDKRE